MKVSILMSVYNGERYLTQAIDSVLRQTFRGFEFLVVDDGSTDDTAKILQRYAARDSRIRLLKCATNKGLTAALNWGVNELRGEYLARMDADDISLPERLERQVAWLDAHPEIGVLGTAYRLIDGSGDKQLDCHATNEPDFLRWYLCFQNPLAHPSVMMRSTLIREVGGYRNQARYAEDYELWWRLSMVTKLACLPEVLLELRRHDLSVSKLFAAEQRSAKYEVLREMLPQIGAGELCRYLVDPDKPQHRAKFIDGLRQFFIRQSNIIGQSKAMIQMDAADRLALLGVRHPWSAGGAILDSLRLNPCMPQRAWKQSVARHFSKVAWDPILK